jgi:hypothetical protein
MNGRLFTLLLSVALLVVPALCAEPLPIDQADDEREITYAMVGEDAASTYYYFFYRLPRTDTLAKVRLLWNGGAGNKPSITDYYLAGSSILIVERSADRKNLPELLKGRDAPFKTVRMRRIKSVAEEMLIGGGAPGLLSREERLALSNLIHALSLDRKPMGTEAR